MNRSFFRKIANRAYSVWRYRASKKFIKACMKYLDSFEGIPTKSEKGFLHNGHRYKMLIEIDD